MCSVKLSGQLIRILNIRQTCEHFISRDFARWAHRRPVRIVGGEVNNQTSVKLETEKDVLKKGKLTNSEIELVTAGYMKSETSFSDSSEEMNNLHDRNDPKRPAKATSNKHSKVNQDCTNAAKNAHLKEAAMKLGVPVFTKVGNDDSQLSKYLVDIKSRKNKSKRKYVLLEGKRLIQDAVKAGVIPKAVFFSHVEDIRDLSLPMEGVELYKITYKTLRLWSDMSTCPGVMGIVPISEIIKDRPKSQTASFPLTVICDNIRDPGNLGTILRTAAAVGCEEVMLTQGCVESWNTKVLRGGAGAHFRVKIHDSVPWDTIYEEVKNKSVFLADSRMSLIPGWTDENIVDNSEGIVVHDEQAKLGKMPIIPYYAFNFSCTEQLALIIGGETSGLSQDALRLGCEVKGVRLNIPLSNGVDSVNTGIALGIIAYEMKRQLHLKEINNSGRKSVSAQNL